MPSGSQHPTRITFDLPDKERNAILTMARLVLFNFYYHVQDALNIFHTDSKGEIDEVELAGRPALHQDVADDRDTVQALVARFTPLHDESEHTAWVLEGPNAKGLAGIRAKTQDEAFFNLLSMRNNLTALTRAFDDALVVWKESRKPIFCRRDESECECDSDGWDSNEWEDETALTEWQQLHLLRFLANMALPFAYQAPHRPKRKTIPTQSPALKKATPGQNPHQSSRKRLRRVVVTPANLRRPRRLGR